MKILKLILLTTITISIYSCAKHPEIYTGESEQQTYTGGSSRQIVRTLVLGGEDFEDLKPSDFISWKCRDYSSGGKTLVEVGKVLIPEDYMHSDEYKEMDDATKEQLDEIAGMLGFILYDGTNTGDGASYKRRGLNHRWDWGSEGKYSFIIKPDGTGLFYDFSTVDNGVKKNADDVYRCSR